MSAARASAATTWAFRCAAAVATSPTLERGALRPHRGEVMQDLGYGLSCGSTLLPCARWSLLPRSISLVGLKRVVARGARSVLEHRRRKQCPSLLWKILREL